VTLKSWLGVTQVTENGTIRKLGYGYLFAFCSDYGRVFSRLRYAASTSNKGVTLKTGVGVV